MNGGMLQLSGIVVDLVLQVEALPVGGREVEAQSVEISAGGGFNAMASARRMGVDVAYGGVLGTGLFADLAADALNREGISPLLPLRRAIDQGNCIVLVDSNAERSFISSHGAERQVEADCLQALNPHAFKWLLLSGYQFLKSPSAQAFASWLERLEAGPSLLFDPGPIVAEISERRLRTALSRTDWLSVNAYEAGLMTGADDPERSVFELARNRKGALVRTGADGCWLATEDADPAHVAGFVVEAIDTTGAGDTHVGAFIAGMILGYAPKDASLIANAAAALSTTRPGPATSQGFSRVWAFLEERGIALPKPKPVATIG